MTDKRKNNLKTLKKVDGVKIDKKEVTIDVRQVDFSKRTQEVEVPGLIDLFKDLGFGEVPKITIQNLSSQDLEEAETEAQEYSNNSKMMKILAKHHEDSKVKEEFIKMIDEKNEEDSPKIVMKKYHLLRGIVSPKIDFSFVNRIAAGKPVEFLDLNNKILELTGLGDVTTKK